MKELYIILLWCASLKISISQPEVKCLTGTYVGVERRTYAGIKYDSFMGIQFAQVVERFKEAIPVKNDSSIKFGATKFGPDCYQKESKNDPVEDCLYLNVYSPDIKGNLPVLFFIYGGGFNMGSTYSYDPEYFMDTKRIVVVTVAYRLGPFGFLYFDDPKYPANLGLRDQILGLKWVKQNIANFGGDPNRITINGQSAGAASVNILMHSPLAKGLFVGGISESGTSCSPWALQPRCTGLHKLQLLAARTGCGGYLPNNDRKWSAEPIANCLNMLTPRQITAAVQYFPKWELIVPFPPIVEEESVPQPVITIFPWMNSSYSDNLVPWISGTNSDEATDLVREYYPNNALESLAIKIFNGFVLSELLYYRYTSFFPLLITAEIKLHFFKDNILNFQRFISEVKLLIHYLRTGFSVHSTQASDS